MKSYPGYLQASSELQLDCWRVESSAYSSKHPIEESFMSEATLDQVIQEVKVLPAGLQRQLRDQLNEWLEKNENEKKLDRMLMEAGLLTEIPAPVADFTPWQNRRPVQVEGQPLSESIIEERR
jgi:hypothetical protein